MSPEEPSPDEMRALRVELTRDGERLEHGSAEWERWLTRHGERELRSILMTAWDPIGVGDTPEAWDEYDDYLAGVALRLRDATDPDDAEEAVGGYLHRVERGYMGCTLHSWRENRDLASMLVAWHEWSCRRRGRPPREWVGTNDA